MPRKKKAPVSQEAPHPIDVVQTVTEMEAMTFRALDAEARNLELDIKNLTNESIIAEKHMADLLERYKAGQEKRKLDLDGKKVELESTKQRYLEWVTELASRYRMEATTMAIDPESRIIRDLRNESGKQDEVAVAK